MYKDSFLSRYAYTMALTVRPHISCTTSLHYVHSVLSIPSSQVVIRSWLLVGKHLLLLVDVSVHINSVRVLLVMIDTVMWWSSFGLTLSQRIALLRVMSLRRLDYWWWDRESSNNCVGWSTVRLLFPCHLRWFRLIGKLVIRHRIVSLITKWPILVTKYLP